MIHENTFKKVEFNGSKGLVFIEDKILTYRRDQKTNKYPLLIDLPGGGRENDESPFETFKREIVEEFGIRINKEDVCFSSKVISVVDPNQTAYFIVVKPKGVRESDVVFGDEGLEWFLMTPEEFVNKPDGIGRQQKRVKDYISGNLVSE